VGCLLGAVVDLVANGADLEPISEGAQCWFVPLFPSLAQANDSDAQFHRVWDRESLGFRCSQGK
jgi:hypothetical protein